VPVTLDIGGDASEGNLFTAMRSYGYALSLGPCVTNASVRSNEFSANDYGIYYSVGWTPLGPMRAVFEHNRLRNHLYGVCLSGPISVDSFTQNSIEASSNTALTLSYPWSGWITFKARGNAISNNANGIYITAWGANFDDPAQPPPDFGTALDPGGNVLSCNSSSSSSGADVTLDGYGTGTFPFVGNVWDHSPPTVAFGYGPHPDGSDILSYDTGWSVDTSGSSADAGTDAGPGACATGYTP
jgi:hypothetical protein